MTPKTYFEELSYALRRKELLPRATEEERPRPVPDYRKWSRPIRPDLGGHRSGEG